SVPALPQVVVAAPREGVDAVEPPRDRAWVGAQDAPEGLPVVPGAVVPLVPHGVVAATGDDVEAPAGPRRDVGRRGHAPRRSAQATRRSSHLSVPALPQVVVAAPREGVDAVAPPRDRAWVAGQVPTQRLPVVPGAVVPLVPHGVV